jgi:hypothetical protein
MWVLQAADYFLLETNLFTYDHMIGSAKDWRVEFHQNDHPAKKSPVFGSKINCFNLGDVPINKRNQLVSSWGLPGISGLGLCTMRTAPTTASRGPSLAINPIVVTSSAVMIQ